MPGSKINLRPDFRCEELKLIIEFDGYRHYSNSSVIINDMIKRNCYHMIGYKIVRIPYFVQLNKAAVIHFFGDQVESNTETDYPSGFWDDSCMLPCDYCEMGIRRFVKEMNEIYPIIKLDITYSLYLEWRECKSFSDKTKILPPSLFYIIEEDIDLYAEHFEEMRP